MTIGPKYAGTAEQQSLIRAMMQSDIIPSPSKSETNPYWAWTSHIEFTTRYSQQAAYAVARIEKQLEEQRDQIIHLTALVQRLVDKHAPLTDDTPEATP